MNKKKVNSFTAEDVGDFNTPTYTKDAADASARMFRRIQELNMPLPGFSSGNVSRYTKDELQALKYIQCDREVPQDLANRIKEYRKKNPCKSKSSYNTVVASPEEIERELGIRKEDQ